MFDLNIDEEITILEKYNITPTELFVVKAINAYIEDYSEDYLRRYLAIDKKYVGSFIDILKSLQDKGLILKSYKIIPGMKLVPEEIPFNKNFLKCLAKSSFEMGKELREHYPRFRNINGCLTSMLGVSKKFNSLEDAYKTYGKKIHWNEELHKKIIDLLDWEANTDNGIINYSLATFIVDEKWEDLEALKNGDSGMNYNSITTL